MSCGGNGRKQTTASQKGLRGEPRADGERKRRETNGTFVLLRWYLELTGRVIGARKGTKDTTQGCDRFVDSEFPLRYSWWYSVSDSSLTSPGPAWLYSSFTSWRDSSAAASPSPEKCDSLAAIKKADRL